MPVIWDGALFLKCNKINFVCIYAYIHTYIYLQRLPQAVAQQYMYTNCVCLYMCVCTYTHRDFLKPQLNSTAHRNSVIVSLIDMNKKVFAARF